MNTNARVSLSDRIECTEHDGRHAGTVVHIMGNEYAVAWDDRNINFGRTGRPGSTDPQYPAHFLEGHTQDLVSVSPNRIRPSNDKT